MYSYPVQDAEQEALVKELTDVFGTVKIRTVGMTFTPVGIIQNREISLQDPLPVLQNLLFRASKTGEYEPLRTLVNGELPFVKETDLEPIVTPYRQILSALEQELRLGLDIRRVCGNDEIGLVVNPIPRNRFRTHRFVRYPHHVTFFRLDDVACATPEEALAKHWDKQDETGYVIEPTPRLTLRYSIERTRLPFFAYRMLGL